VSSGYAAGWSYEREREAAARRAQRAEIAALQGQVHALSRQAAALRRLIGGWQAPVLADAPGSNVTSAELARHAERIRTVVQDAQKDLDRRVADAWTVTVQDSLSRAAASTTGRRWRRAAGPASPPAEQWQPSQERQAAGLAASPPAGTANISAEVSKARQALAEFAGSCHPDDVERLQRLALGLANADLVSAQALRHSVAESVARRKQADLAAATRARLRVIVTDTPAAEQPTLLQLLDSTPDSGLPGLEVQISESVRRADRTRSRAKVAEAAVAALREIGCAVDDGFATYLSAADALIAPLREHPGYGLRVRLSATSLETLVVRQPGADGACGAAVQQGVCDRMDPAWALLAQAGVRLAEQHRVPAGLQAVPVVSAGQWTAEGHSANRSGQPAAGQWQPQAEPTLQKQPYEH
jgi:hypothetical protein